MLATMGIIYFKQDTRTVLSYESERYKTSIERAALFTDDFCVATPDITTPFFEPKGEMLSYASFHISDKQILCSKGIHEKRYPASLTKTMTAYLALKYGNLEDTVTVSKEAVTIPLDSSRARLLAGDQLSLKDLLYGLMLPSGNDSANAIAEHISGSIDAFVALMNEEAYRMGATNTHFTTPHGYHDDDHYTTAYDMYLIFQTCIQNDTFNEIISTKEYEGIATEPNGMKRSLIWYQTNYYVNGAKSIPENTSVIGGKTGTTDEAGACLILYTLDSEQTPYISIILGAENKALLYENMSELITIHEREGSR